MNIKFLIPALFLILTINSSFGQDVQLRVVVPDQVAVGDQFRLIFSVNADGDGFKAPPIRDFSLLSGPNRGSSSSMQIVNNKVSRTVENTYTYLLQAIKEGTFTIGAASIVVDGKTYQSSPVTVKVTKGNPGAQNAPQQDNAQPGTDISSKNLFLRTSVSKNNPYQGEQIIVTYKLYTRVPIADMAIKKVPALTGFWKENLLENNVNYKQYKEYVNGLEYNVAEIKKDALFAQKSGKLIIDPLELDVIAQLEVKRRRSNDPFDDFFNDSFFGRNYQNIQKTLSSNPITLDIKPLPESKNKDFNGAVGSYTISSTVDKTTVKANDALTFKFTVSGKGNIKMIDKPNFIFPPDFEVYDPKINDNVRTSDAGMSGSRTCEYLIVPRNHGKYTIKSVPFVYFNLASGSYNTLKTQELSITVEKGTGNEAYVQAGADKQDLQYIGTDIRFIQTGLFKLKPINHFFYGSPLFWILLTLPLILFILFIVIWQKELKKRSNVALMRNKKATGIAKKRLKSAEQFLKQGNQAAFCNEISNALWGYISDKFNIARASLSIDSVSEALHKKNVNQELITKFTTTLNNCEFARFAPGDKSEIMSNLYTEALNAITQTEQELKKNRFMKKIIFFLFLLINLIDSATADPLADISKANQFYKEGNYQSAISLYKKVIDMGYSSPELYYNLGNAYYKANEIPLSILFYERALKLDPGNEDLNYNLKVANNQIIDKIDLLPKLFYERWWDDLKQMFSPDVWAIITIILFTLFFIILAGFLLSVSIRIRKALLSSALILLIISAFSFIISFQTFHKALNRQEAIVFAASLPVKSSPEESGIDLFVIHEGLKVEIIDQLSGWKEIRIANGSKGWVRSETITPI